MAARSAAYGNPEPRWHQWRGDADGGAGLSPTGALFLLVEYLYQRTGTYSLRDWTACAGDADVLRRDGRGAVC
ncbi:MAG: hypothetical protein U0Z44_08275 [Kouleothrix sp.]